MPSEDFDFIKYYMQYSRINEAPTIFHTWCCLSTLSAALERRCWNERDTMERIYPNQYIILVGPSAVRKGVAQWHAENLMEKSGLNLGTNTATRQNLVMQFNSFAETVLINGHSYIQSPMTIVSREAYTLLGQRDSDKLSDFTDWYECKPTWSKGTNIRGGEIVEGMCFNLLAATTPNQIPVMLPPFAIDSGFSPRCIWVYASNKSRIIASTELEAKKEFGFQSYEEYEKYHNGLERKLIAWIKKLKQINGRFTYSPEAEEARAEWYTEYNEEWQAGRPPIDDRNMEAYLGRRETHLRKLCMIMSAGRRLTKLITLKDFQDALMILEEAERRMPKAFRGIGTVPFAETMAKCYQLIVNSKARGVLRSEIMKIHHRNITPAIMQQMQEAWAMTGNIRMYAVPTPNGEGDVRYVSTGVDQPDEEEIKRDDSSNDI